MAFDRKKMAERYHELCDKRDRVYKEAEPLEAELDRVNLERMKLEAKAHELASQIEETWAKGSEKGTKEGWIELKKEIADIARFLIKIPSKEVKE